MIDLANNLCDGWIPLNKERIKEFERDVDLNLPRDYVDFLLRINGGKMCRPCQISFDSKRASERWLVSGSPSEFFSVGCPSSLSWRDVKQVLSWHQGHLPPTAIPIATSGEDLFLLDCDSNSILYWERDAEESGTFEVAPNFTSFVEHLEIDAEELDSLCSELKQEEERFILRHQNNEFSDWLDVKAQSLASQDFERLFAVSCQHCNREACSALLERCNDALLESLLIQALDEDFADAFLLLLERGVRSIRKSQLSEYMSEFYEAWKKGECVSQSS